MAANGIFDDGMMQVGKLVDAGSFVYDLVVSLVGRGWDSEEWCGIRRTVKVKITVVSHGPTSFSVSLMPKSSHHSVEGKITTHPHWVSR